MLLIKTVLAEAVLVKTKSASGSFVVMTVVVAESKLFSVTGSVTDEVTLAVLVIVSGKVGVTVMVTVADALFAMLPALHVTMPFVCVQVPLVVWAEINETFGGNTSVITTDVVVDGPAFLTNTV